MENAEVILNDYNKYLEEFEGNFYKRTDKKYGMTDMYYYFRDEINNIPDEYKLMLFIDAITTKNPMGEGWYEVLVNCIEDMTNEISEIIKVRVREFIKKANGQLDENDYITLYKGKNDIFNEIPDEKDFNFTLDKDIALGFSNRCCGMRAQNNPRLVEYKIHIDDIKYFVEMDKEIIVAPLDCKELYRHRIIKISE